MALQQQIFHQQMHQQQQQQHNQHQHQQQAAGASRHPILPSQSGQRAHYYRPGMVPPTPNSVEMQGAQVHAFTDSQALGMYESGKHQDQVSAGFTNESRTKSHILSTDGLYALSVPSIPAAGV